MNTPWYSITVSVEYGSSLVNVDGMDIYFIQIHCIDVDDGGCFQWSEI